MNQSSKQKFLNDLEAGRAGEVKVARVLREFYGADSIVQESLGKHHDFKLVFGDSEEAFEVKTDFYAAKSGNIFLEFACNSKPSGLLATKSFRWAILLPHLNEVVLFCPKKMWTYLERSKHRKVNGGDGFRASGYLVNIDALKDLPFTTTVPAKC